MIGVRRVEGPHYMNLGVSLFATSGFPTDGLVTGPRLRFRLSGIQVESALGKDTHLYWRDAGTRIPGPQL